jgi:2-C-methyl-D-erythritol 2,4-cyclodiphosphate synthase
MTPPLPFRIGHGYDLHRLQPGGQLMLGGVMVSDRISPVAHSDGDVVLHALTDALLGAMGWGDLGEHFPNDDPKLKGASSSLFVSTIFKKVLAAGLHVGNVDITILAERPRLSTFKPAIAESVAKMLGAPKEHINIKACSNEGCDSIGSGQAIAANAVVVLLNDSAKS